MMTLYSAAVTLILVMDPLGNIPPFLAALRQISAKKRRYIIIRESTIAFVILSIFLLFGQYILEGLHISQPALSIAGGIILFIIAIRMIFPHEEPKGTKETAEPFIVPLAVPLIAGPSTMAVVMLMAKQSQALFHVFWALVIAWLITTIVLLFADLLRKMLGERGLTAIERLMGMILTTMAVQMFLSGFQLFLNR